MTFVFVYGTLKRGQCNHHWLSGAPFVGRARLAGVELHSLGPYPMAVPSPGTQAVIHGELFRIEPQDLERLDELEDYPDLYDRRQLPLLDGRTAWVYLGRPEQVRGRERVPFADWGTTPVFSYGSNMDPEQLRHRCPQWDGWGVAARLEGWRWGISKVRVGRGEGVGAAGIHPDPAAHCWGVVHHLCPRDLEALDGSEGVGGDHYRHRQVTVATEAGDRFPALTYVPAPHRRAEGLRAEAAYARRILDGAAHHGLPSEWCQTLRESLLITTRES